MSVLSMRRIRIRYLSYALLFCTIWFLWPRELDGFLLGRDGRTSVPDYAMTNARYVSVKEGKIELESVAKEAFFDLIQRKMDAKVVTSFFYNDKGEKTVVNSDLAYFFMEDRHVRMVDHVKSVSPDGFEMRGPEALYFINKKIFQAPLPVEGDAKSKDMQIWGDSAQSNLNDNKVSLIGNARAQFKDPKRGLTKIRGDRSEMDRNTDLVQFFKNVIINQDKIVATGNRADIYFSREQRAVRYMSVLEDVKIQESNGKYTRSQVAEFFAPTDTIVLTGFPSVYDGDDAVTGDKITLYRGTGVVEVTATNAAANSSSLEKKASAPPHSEEDDELIP